ncbi:MAG: EamA family transporter [Lachnospiraceae bacterium]|nr:EamA family transporter [Lachnospiraceae bacterium]
MKKAYISVIMAAVFWGTMGLFGRYMNAMGLNQIQVAMLRVFVAAVVMAFVLLIKDKKLFKVRLKDIWCFVGTGIVSLTLFNFCYFTAVNYTTLSVVTVLVYTAPAFVMLFSAVLFNEKITATRLGALGLMLLGCILVTGFIGSGSEGITPTGILFGLAAGVTYALYSIFCRYALNKGYHTFTISFYTFLFSSLATLPFADVGNIVVRMTPDLGLLALGLGFVACVLPYMCYTKGLEKLKNGTASTLATLDTAVSTLVGVIAFKEPLEWYHAAGIAVLFVGIMVLSKAKD